MSLENPKCRITVLKRFLYKDLIEEFLDEKYKDVDFCECFKEGQEFVLDGYSALSDVPENFCASAWADIRQDVMTIVFGGNLPGLKKHGTAVSGCRDWFRPVLFKIERIENA